MNPSPEGHTPSETLPKPASPWKQLTGVAGKCLRAGLEHHGDGGGAGGRGGAGACGLAAHLGGKGEVARPLDSDGDVTLIHHHEAFFNGSLILTADRTGCARNGATGSYLIAQRCSWINNCSTPEALVDNFISALMKIR